MSSNVCFAIEVIVRKEVFQTQILLKVLEQKPLDEILNIQ